MSKDNEKLSIMFDSTITTGDPSWSAFTVLIRGKMLIPSPTAGKLFPYFPISSSYLPPD